MNKRIKELAVQARHWAHFDGLVQYPNASPDILFEQKFAELIVEVVLDQVKERAYYTGDRDWSDEMDRPWIQLEFGYGSLADAKKGIFK